jgi:hypothetical protein
MSAAIASAILLTAGLYLAVGLVFALAFVFSGIERIDPGARGSSLGFRLIVLPGAATLWPVLALRWLGGASGPPEQTDAHARAAAREDAR